MYVRRRRDRSYKLEARYILYIMSLNKALFTVFGEYYSNNVIILSIMI